MDKPKKCHWEAAYGILRYIKKAFELGLFYKKNNHTNIVGYSDADYASSKKIDDQLLVIVHLLEEIL